MMIQHETDDQWKRQQDNDIKNYVTWVNDCENDAGAAIGYGKAITNSSVFDAKKKPECCSNYDNNIINVFIDDMLLKECKRSHPIYQRINGDSEKRANDIQIKEQAHSKCHI